MQHRTIIEEWLSRQRRSRSFLAHSNCFKAKDECVRYCALQKGCAVFQVSTHQQAAGQSP